MSRSKTPPFLLELPLQVTAEGAQHLRAHFEVARCLYNALLGEAMKRLKRMQADKSWQEARAIPKTRKQDRNALFSELRQQYGFSEYALHEYASSARTAWIADHVDANTAQKLASRAYQAANRVCLGKARKVRFKSKGRGLDSLEGKTNKQGLHFVLQDPKEGNGGWLVWGKERFAAKIERRCNNVRERGKLSPKALASPEPERVCLEVLPATSKSYALLAGTQKRWHVGKNPLRLSQGSLRLTDSLQRKRC
jgi:hypothetical protein